jgi:hypothetical protein
MIVCGKPTRRLLDMQGVTPEQVNRFYRLLYGLTRAGHSVSLFPLRILVVQYRFDHECPDLSGGGAFFGRPSRRKVWLSRNGLPYAVANRPNQTNSSEAQVDAPSESE